MTGNEGTSINLLLMAEILHQLRLVVFPIIDRVSAPSQVVGNGISAISQESLEEHWTLGARKKHGNVYQYLDDGDR